MNNKRYVDMHLHSYFSDGSMSPEELVASAHRNGVSVLALADHDMLDGNKIFEDECKKYNMSYIPAVEIDTREGIANHHVLAYGFDIYEESFREYIKHVRFMLDEISVKLIDLMQRDYTDLSLSEYMDFSYDRELGGWKGLHYLLNKGLISSLKEGIKFYSEYGVTYDKSGYSSISIVSHRIKKAGGYSVLAHPGETIDTSNTDTFRKELQQIVSYGIDGIECYYPSHSKEITEICVDICKNYNLLITTGSDCHGSFGKAKVGEMHITLDQIFLKDLLERKMV